jgi:hypothetical protein
MMTSRNLDNLVKVGSLAKAAISQKEFDGLVKSGRVRLKDAKTSALSIESRFDLAYNASHALALAALRWHGYRSENRQTVFQCLEETLGIPPAKWQVFSLCHQRRNVAEYEGDLNVEDRLVADLIEITEALSQNIARLGKVP